MLEKPPPKKQRHAAKDCNWIPNAEHERPPGLPHGIRFVFVKVSPTPIKTTINLRWTRIGNILQIRKVLIKE